MLQEASRNNTWRSEHTRMDTGKHPADTLEKQPSDTQMSSDLAMLAALMERQMREAAAREERLATMLHESLTHSNLQRIPNSDSIPQRPQQVNVERPILLASSTFSDFLAWKEAWLDFAQCQHFDRQDKQTRTAALRQSLDEDLRRYVRQGIVEVGDNHDIDQIMSSLEKFICRQRNPLLDHMDYYNLMRGENETFDSFYTTLGELHKACEFDADRLCTECAAVIRQCEQCHNWSQRNSAEIMRNRLVVGTRDPETKHRLLSQANLKLEQAVQIC